PACSRLQTDRNVVDIAVRKYEIMTELSVRGSTCMAADWHQSRSSRWFFLTRRGDVPVFWGNTSFIPIGRIVSSFFRNPESSTAASQTSFTNAPLGARRLRRGAHKANRTKHSCTAQTLERHGHQRDMDLTDSRDSEASPDSHPPHRKKKR